MSEFNNKVVIVTGSASGIGRQTALYFSEQGAIVACVDIDEEKNKEVCEEITKQGGRAFGFIGNVSIYNECKNIVEEIINKLNSIDILFNNAGIIRRTDVVTSTEDEWDLVINVNLKSVFLMSKMVIPHMIKAGGGNIINTASGWGVNGGGRAASYCASKGGVVLLTKSMALDFGKDNIRVNAVCPGDTDTFMLKGEAKQLDIPYQDILSAGSERPLQRIGKPEEIANVVGFLASEKSSFVTGSIYVVDGGSLAGSP